MIEDKQKCFENVIKLIKDKKYSEAIEELDALLKDNDEEKRSHAQYLIGYVNTRSDYEERKEYEAKKYLYSNINGQFPHPHAFVLYSSLIKDVNIAENYLKKGIQCFPNEPKIYTELFLISSDKEKLIQDIKDKGFSDAILLGKVISYLIDSQQWDRVGRFVFRIENGNELDEEEKQYLTFVSTYALLFGTKNDFDKAKNIFEKLIIDDIDNDLEYAHYICLIYVYIKLGDFQKATEFFDRLPVTNSILDFDDRPRPFNIYINFEKQYKTIFENIFNLYSKDKKRKNKASALYALYLYSPSTMFEIHRYGKKDATALTRYLKDDFNVNVARALYNMRCYFKQYKEAYDVFWMFLNEYINPENYYVYFFEITSNATPNDMLQISNQTELKLKKQECDEKLFLLCVFSELIEKLHDNKQFEQIQNIAQFFTTEQILESGCAFDCAYAYGETNNERSIEIYEKFIQKNPNNSPAINNLGVQYEHKGDYFKALEYYEKGVSIEPSDETLQRNLKRVHTLISKQNKEEISTICNSLSLDSLTDIGYTIQLCQKVLLINDDDMKNIIFRDLKECAIAIISNMDKTATVLCGSIIEALLMLKLKDKGINKYDISEISKSSHATKYPLNNMLLNELLFVAEKEGVIEKNIFHLGHFVRDFRNVVHPAKEIRMKENVTHENVLTMWTVLKRLIDELL